MSVNNNGHIVIGIDPDVDKSGYSEWDIKQQNLTVSAYSFFEIFDLLQSSKEEIYLVRIEAGWLNEKSNFHGYYGQTKNVGERIAKNVGSNHEVGRKLAEMCDFLDIPYELVKPLGTKSIKAEEFKKITKWSKRTNQDMRDSAMLCYKYK